MVRVCLPLDNVTIAPAFFKSSKVAFVTFVSTLFNAIATLSAATFFILICGLLPANAEPFISYSIGESANIYAISSIGAGIIGLFCEGFKLVLGGTYKPPDEEELGFFATLTVSYVISITESLRVYVLFFSTFLKFVSGVITQTFSCVIHLFFTLSISVPSWSHRIQYRSPVVKQLLLMSSLSEMIGEATSLTYAVSTIPSGVVSSL